MYDAHSSWTCIALLVYTADRLCSDHTHFPIASFDELLNIPVETVFEHCFTDCALYREFASAMKMTGRSCVDIDHCLCGVFFVTLTECHFWCVWANISQKTHSSISNGCRASNTSWAFVTSLTTVQSFVLHF